mmetsp:Transcript_18457/g.44253  ORF Transcript_18457/g.44253 Transcript_18457/m.44253 type:complete len:302 (+) Transcript_18457:354-1259(+)
MANAHTRTKAAEEDSVRLSAERSDAMARAVAAESEAAAARAAQREAAATIAKLEAQVLALQARDTASSDRSDEVASLRRQIEVLVAGREAATARAEESEWVLREATERQAAEHRELDRLRAQLALNGSDQGKVGALEAASGQYRAARDAAVAVAEKLQVELNKAEGRAGQAEGRCAELEQAARLATEEAAALRRREGERHGDTATEAVKRELDKEREDKARLKTRLDTSLASQEREREHLVRSIKTLQTAMEALRGEKATLIRDHDRERERLVKSVKTLQTTVEGLRGGYGDAHSTLDDTR